MLRKGQKPGVEYHADMRGKTCQETWGMIGEKYLYCGKPAVMTVQHRGRSEGPYDMCLEHGEHNARNRDAQVLARSSCCDREMRTMEGGCTNCGDPCI